MSLLDGLGNIARTLAHRNSGVYVAGNSVSLIGTWMQRIGVGWLSSSRPRVESSGEQLPAT